MIAIPAYPWGANRVLLLATFIVHSIMGPARIGDKHESPGLVDASHESLFLPLVYFEISLLNMKPVLKLILVVIGVLLSVNLLTLTQAARMHTSGVWSSATAAPSTEALFKQKCTKCHGTDGSGDTSLGRIFNAPDFTDSGWWARHPNTAEHIQAITKGRKNMPAFGKKLTKAQIASLASYVQRFRH